LKWMTNSQKRRVALLSTHARSISSCMSYAILNLGTLMASKTRVTHNGQNIDKPGFDNSLEKPYYLTPSEASQQCEFAYDAMNGDGQSIIINYTIMY
ncbi:branched-chain alpha-keto acid dehydrogenase subunit E2, partial [Escherichia coli O86:H18]